MFRTRQRSLDAYYLFLEGQWSGGCRNGAELWRRLQAAGRGQNTGAAAVALGRKQFGRRKESGRPVQSDVIMSGIVDNGR